MIACVAILKDIQSGKREYLNRHFYLDIFHSSREENIIDNYFPYIYS